MIDAVTHEPLRVSGGDATGPYMVLPVSQLGRVVALLEREQLPHWIDPCTLSVGGRPAITVVNFHRGVPAYRVQQLLDTEIE